MRRVLALVVAAGLVAGALWVRGNVVGRGAGAGSTDDDAVASGDPTPGGASSEGGAGAAGAGADGAAGEDAGGTLRVTCAEVAATACEGLESVPTLDLEVRIEPAADTAARLVPVPDGAADLDVWVTGAVWPAIVDETRARSGRGSLFGTRVSEALARTPLLLAAWEERSAALEGHCGGDVTWACLGGVTGEPWDVLGGEAAWGGVDVGLADPTTTVTGLAVLGQAASGFFGGPDFSRNDFRGDFGTWLRDLIDAAEVTGDPLDRMLRFGRALDLAATTEAAVLRRAGAARELPRAHVAAPAVTVDVVAASTGPELPPDARGALVEAFRAAGWHVQGAAPEGSAAVTLPPTDGLPAAGVLEALRQEWEGIAG